MCIHVRPRIHVRPVCSLFMSDVKRIMGQDFQHPGVQSDIKHWPFKVIDDCGKPKVCVKVEDAEKTFTPEQISSMILTKMKETAESYLGRVRFSISFFSFLSYLFLFILQRNRL